MHVVITGGTGLIGRALAADLPGAGHEVTILTRDPSRAIGLPAGVGVERWDAATTGDLADIVGRADAIVHLAGETIAGGRWTTARKRRILDSRVSSTAALSKVITQVAHKPRVLVQASAVGYYGRQGDNLVTEDDPRAQDYLGRVCGQWEGASQPVADLGVRRPVIRTGLVLAREGGALPRMLPLFKLGVAGPLGGGRQWWPWIHLADEVAAVRFLIEHDRATGPFNLTAPNPVTNAEFSRELGRVLRRPARMPVPAAALRLAFGEMATVLLDGQRAVPRNLTDLGFAFRFPELGPALRDILR